MGLARQLTPKAELRQALHSWGSQVPAVKLENRSKLVTLLGVTEGEMRVIHTASWSFLEEIPGDRENVITAFIAEMNLNTLK